MYKIRDAYHLELGDLESNLGELKAANIRGDFIKESILPVAIASNPIFI